MEYLTLCSADSVPVEGTRLAATSLARRSVRSVWHPCTALRPGDTVEPLAIARGEGVWLIDTEGRRYFDATSSWWVNLFGHANPHINAALVHQLETLEHVMLAGCTHAPAVELGERLSALTGGALGNVFYASDGASAVEIALKMSFHYWRNIGLTAKREFICLRNGYHGETVGALAVTDVEIFRDAYDPLIRRAHVVMSPDGRQAVSGESAADVAARALAELEALLRERSGQIAALIVEPLVQGAAGMAMHDPSYLDGARALCDRYRVHLIADEIAVGCGRTGTFFAWEQSREGRAPLPAHLWPDFLCLSKGISGGYLPLSLVLSRPEIQHAFIADDVARSFLHSHSYTGNPLACRAALATLDLFEYDHVIEQNRQRAQWLGEALASLGADARLMHTRQRGVIWAADVRPEFAGADFSARFHRSALAHGVLARPIGNTLYVLPPYCFDQAQAQWLGQQLQAALDATLTEASQIQGGAPMEVCHAA
ncbi:adenosylmethionine--8-amino-7-oxononanoate aminotransferase BioA [Cupriavidus sp. TA19]|uniref:adenosylmethionine--8-amino-7-oxononanoate transaminase n=1 Tax=unclassified Cupriavidus TaxID=2640874 RepID=UPI000E2EE4EC|nr:MULTISPECIES: adenosylmethionine--8-amino-7-oxononanoate transaminase [unclassified Cupriavidus]BDB30694.1 adenosylmethionine--8-amino-7-oxononanoate transaminase [Cupriavidus sp. P-10]GLC91768.1 adenosylmethionine--8-amino-7-oxononanoate aminotransferase BioA [Cupriavidus sp. TA19]